MADAALMEEVATEEAEAPIAEGVVTALAADTAGDIGSAKQDGSDVVLPVPGFLKRHWLVRLFFSRKFLTHRLMGLAYLIQWFAAFYLYLFDYDRFRHSTLVWLLPLCGLVQSITAIYTFTFLPRKKDPGITFLSDRSVLSYFFIVENSFFEMLLLFQWLYYSDVFYPLIRASFAVELVFVFLPYFIRPLWPKTRIRVAVANVKNKSALNRSFMIASSYVVKAFYIFAKHYIGYFLNYVRFLNLISPHEQYLVFGLLITSAFATTIAIFLHTLKFKRYIGPRTATLVYEAAYVVVAFFFIRMASVFLISPDIAVLTFVGLLVNFASPRLQQAWQLVMVALLYGRRYEYIAWEPFIQPDAAQALLPSWLAF